MRVSLISTASIGRFRSSFLLLPVMVAVLFATGGAFVTGADQSSNDSPAVDFARDIRPLLIKHCADCHGADTAESGLRVDFASLVLRGGDRGALFVPGKPDESLLVKALLGQGIKQMPEGEPPLDAATIEKFRQWIAQGAKVPQDDVPDDETTRFEHWSFQPIQRPLLPAVQNEDWIRNDIDRFVLARLEDEGLQPSSDADRATLIRRLSLDLTGVLPGPADIQQFVDDQQPGAYERLVDRLLASPRYGERWGRHWLDIARYADSNGFTIDGPRSIWPYRDWVIQAINDDLPFDEFVTQQLAGDLLPDATRDQIVATGFHRNTLINQEGGTDQEQFRVEAVVDRVNTTGAAFLGLTIGCAQCHVHKYDPITQREFYEVFAVFNNCDEPQIPLPDDVQAAEQSRIKTELDEVNRLLKEHDQARAAGQGGWEREQLAVTVPQWQPIRPVSAESDAGATLNMVDESTILSGGNGNIPAQDVFVITTELTPDNLAGAASGITALRLEAVNNPLLPQTGPGWADNGNFVLSEFEATLRLTGSDAAPQAIRFEHAITDWQQEGYTVGQAIDGNQKTGWAINGPQKSSPNVRREAIFIPRSPLPVTAATTLTIRLHQNHSEPKYLLGSFRLSLTTSPLTQQPKAETSGIDNASAVGTIVPDAVRSALSTTASERDAGQIELLTAAYSRSDVSRKPLEDRQSKLKGEERELSSAIPTTMVLRERSSRRETHIHIRGNFLEHGAIVEPGVPSVLPRMRAAEGPASRLDFARWLFEPEHPLTARVTVNRSWQRFFGIGIVETENDFGTQGSAPTHPELLDWLSSELMRQNWSMKALHRVIVMSSTYRQASHVTPELLARDPRNRLLARQSRIRLEAELVRDVALAASGLLSQKMFGPGVYPPQPQGIYVVTQVSKQWPESQGDDRFRRGLYTYFWRSSPYPMLPTFDAPDANGTCTRRNRSNTPLQALTLANDASFVELARGLSDRVLRDASEYDEARLRLLFQAALSRQPSDQELKRIGDFVTAQREHFTQDSAAAEKLASPHRPGNVDAPTSATWTATARVILNLDEFITRE